MTPYNSYNVFQDTVSMGANQSSLNVLVYLPGGKVSGIKPAFWFFNGLTESTGPVSKLTVWGPFSFIGPNWKPDFVCVAVQNLSWRTQAQIDTVYATLKSRYGIGNIVATGLSEGGFGVMKEIATYANTQISKDIKAIIPMSTSEGQHPDGVAGIIASKIGVWAFGDDPGDIHGINTHKDFISLAAKNPTGPYIWTRTTDGHSGWNKQYNPTYKGTNGLSIYEWGMKFANISAPPVEPPVDTTPKTHVIVGTGQYISIDNKVTKQYNPGDTIQIKGNVAALSITGLEGTADKRITITNVPGEIATLGRKNYDGTWSSALGIKRSKFFDVLGEKKGSFVIDGTSNEAYFGLELTQLDTDFTVQNIVIKNVGTGLISKTNPVLAEPDTYNTVNKMRNLKFKNIEISNTLNEGMYVGHTAMIWNVTDNTTYWPNNGPKDPSKLYVEPIKIEDAIFENIHVFDTGADGIQISATDRPIIDNCSVSNWGKQHNSSHCGGILLGGRCEESYITNSVARGGWGEPFQFFAGGLSGRLHKIHNCLLADNEYGSGMQLAGHDNALLQISNVTIANIAGQAIRVNGNRGMTSPVLVSFSALINPKGYWTGATIDRVMVYKENGGQLNELNDAYIATLEAAKVTADFLPIDITSPVIGVGYRPDDSYENDPKEVIPIEKKLISTTTVVTTVVIRAYDDGSTEVEKN